ncbi:MAG: hypothetical protein AB1772_13380 [Candidatus Zixiibacteriota bacterium]
MKRILCIMMIIIGLAVCGGGWAQELTEYGTYRYRTCKPTVRPWGIEQWIDLFDDRGTHVRSFAMNYRDKAPADLTDKIHANIDRIDAELHELPVEPEVPMTKSEIEAILKEKGYLEADQKLEDLPVKTAEVEAPK